MQAHLQLSESEREILNLVRAHQPIARANLTELTRLRQQSVHRLVEGLIARQFLATQKAIVKGRGKPSPQITLNEQASAAIGVSIRTDKVEVCAVTPSGSILTNTLLNAAPNDRQAVLSELKALVSNWFANGPLHGRLGLGVGAAMQGYRTTHQNQFTTSLPIESWSRIPIDELLRDTLDLPAFVENNANCSAIAEQHSGGGRSFRSFAYLSFNHGFGGGIIYESEPILGGFGNAGELGELFEVEELEHRPALGELIIRLNDNGHGIQDVNELRERYDSNWVGVDAWLKETSPLLNLTIRAIRAIADPEAIFFGGDAPENLRARLIDMCVRPIANRYGEQAAFPQLLPSKLSGDASVIGAAILPLKMQMF